MDRGQLHISLSREFLSEPFDGATGRSPGGEYAVISVEDDGCGMSRKVQDHIFEALFLHPMTWVRGAEWGCPWFLESSRIIRPIYVYLLYQVKEVFLNCIFPLLLSGDEETRIKKKPVEGKTESILVVDDEQMNCTLYRGLLERLGYRVCDFTDPRKAYEWLRSGDEKVDLVISDQTMPDMTGTELSQLIRAEFPDLPVLICTGFSPQVNKDNYADFGASGLYWQALRLRRTGQSDPVSAGLGAISSSCLCGPASLHSDKAASPESVPKARRPSTP